MISFDYKKLKDISSRAKVSLNRGDNEALCKQLLIRPFLEILGVDFELRDFVIPEYRYSPKDVIDYAFLDKDCVKIILEAKSCRYKITEDALIYQLKRYSDLVDSDYAILTNGVDYSIYGNDHRHRMSAIPIYSFSIFTVSAEDIEKLTSLFKFVEFEHKKTIHSDVEIFLKYLQVSSMHKNLVFLRDLYEYCKKDFAELKSTKKYDAYCSKFISRMLRSHNIINTERIPVRHPKYGNQKAFKLNINFLIEHALMDKD